MRSSAVEPKGTRGGEREDDGKRESQLWMNFSTA